MDLNRLYDKYKARGLVVVAVTDEARDAVDKYVAANKPKYPVVIESVDSGTTFGIVRGYPTQYVIDAAGKIAWAGNFFDADPKCDQILEGLLKDVRIALPAKLAEQQALIDAKKFGEATVGLKKVIDDPAADAGDKAAAAAMVTMIDAQGMRALKDAQTADQEGRSAEAGLAYEAVAGQYAGLTPAAIAVVALKSILADPKKKIEVDGAKALAKAKEQAASLPAKKAIPLYKTVVTKFKNTKAGAEAAQIIKDLEAAR